MRASIITVGTEIIVGSIINTHSQYISKKLNELGVHVSYHISVRDDYDEMKKTILSQLKEVDYIFLCGGLGPTDDDITKEVLADVIGKDIICDKAQYEKLLKRFESLNRPMTNNNIKQAMVIDGSTILDNKWGIAPGEYLDINSKKIFLFPGPPKELVPMVDTYLKGLIDTNDNVLIKSLNIASLGESNVESRLRKLNLESKNISINTFARYFDTEVKIIAEGDDKKSLESEVKRITDKLYEEFGKFLYSEDDMSLSQVLVQKLRDNNLKISFAESITGGLLANKLISIPNASEVITESYITYSNKVKNKVLGVSDKILDTYGAVSKEVALEMARGLKELTNSDICITTTGEAGPIPSEKQVGLCYVCYYWNEDNYEIKEYYFSGSRTDIQQRVADTAILNTIITLWR